MARCAKVMDLGEREKQRLGRQLHDTVCQQLTAIHFQAGALARKLQTAEPALQESFTALRASLRDVNAEMHRLVRSFGLPEQRAGGIAKALRLLVDETSRAIPCTSRLPATMSLQDGVDLQLLRFAQEALANACRHSKARRIWLTVRSRGSTVLAEVRDNGIGFAEARPDPDSGLSLLRERLALLGGTLEILPRKGGGSRVVATLPHGPFKTVHSPSRSAPVRLRSSS